MARPAAGLLLLLLAAATAGGARILALFQMNAKSHFVMYEPLLKALAGRGHRVDVLSHFPPPAAVPNYRDLSLKGTLPDIVNNVTFDVMENFTWSLMIHLFWQVNLDACEVAFRSEPVQRLIKEERAYDLVITEIFSVDCMAPFAFRFGAPLVSLQSSVPLHWALDRTGSPDHPAYAPSYFGSAAPPFSFAERLRNAALGAGFRLVNWLYERRADALCRRYLGADLPPLGALLANTSLLLVNSHSSLSPALPLPPGVVEVAGMHLPPPRALPPDSGSGVRARTACPQDLKRFLDESEHGVVYFAMGSMMRSETMPEGKLRPLLEALSELPQRVVWKVGRGPPAGVRLDPGKFWTADWLPQADLLRHPKVRAFLTHGGQLSVLEAVDAGVPLVGLPLHSDQRSNLRACERHGVALSLEHAHLSREAALAALRAVVADPGFRERARSLSARFRDRQRPPLETAVWWTEYVLRHRGAPHLRSAAADLGWAQLLLLDVGAALAAAAATALAALWLAGRLLLRLCSRLCSRPPRSRKAKAS